MTTLDKKIIIIPYQATICNNIKQCCAVNKYLNTVCFLSFFIEQQEKKRQIQSEFCVVEPSLHLAMRILAITGSLVVPELRRCRCVGSEVVFSPKSRSVHMNFGLRWSKMNLRWSYYDLMIAAKRCSWRRKSDKMHRICVMYEPEPFKINIWWPNWFKTGERPSRKQILKVKTTLRPLQCQSCETEWRQIKESHRSKQLEITHGTACK